MVSESALCGYPLEEVLARLLNRSGYRLLVEASEDSDALKDGRSEALGAAGCIRVFADKKSGKDPDREELRAALDYARPGDTLVVLSLDRFGRSLQDLITIVAGLRERGIGLRSLNEAIDTTTPGGRLVFHVFAALAEFIRELIVEGTREGLGAARARGQRLGRPPAMNAGQVRHARAPLAQPDATVVSIARLLHVSRTTLASTSPSSAQPGSAVSRVERRWRGPIDGGVQMGFLSKILSALASATEPAASSGGAEPRKVSEFEGIVNEVAAGISRVVRVSYSGDGEVSVKFRSGSGKSTWPASSASTSRPETSPATPLTRTPGRSAGSGSECATGSGPCGCPDRHRWHLTPALSRGPHGAAREPLLGHPFGLGHGTPHRGDAANRATVRPVQDLRPRRAARIGRSQHLGPRRPVDALLEKYAHDALDNEPPPTTAPDDELRAWRGHPRPRRHSHRREPPRGRPGPQADRPQTYRPVRP